MTGFILIKNSVSSTTGDRTVTVTQQINRQIHVSANMYFGHNKYCIRFRMKMYVRYIVTKINITLIFSYNVNSKTKVLIYC